MNDSKSVDHLSKREQDEAAQRAPLRSPVIYEVIRQDGEEELSRPLISLWWSGLAAGIALSSSVFAKGSLLAVVPEGAVWAPLVVNFGYPLGFLIVILGRLQLFTENTITVVLPVLADFTRANLQCTARLWAVVLGANLTGTFISALVALHLGLLPANILDASLEIARHFAVRTPGEMLLHGVPAGFLIAALVWLLPTSRANEFWVITVITYFIGLGGMAHVVAGSGEAFLLLLHGEISIMDTALRLILPSLVGNIIGGTFLFTLIAYGQVREEI